MAAPGIAGQMTFLTGPFVGLLHAAEIMRGISRITDVTLEQVRESNSLFKAFDRAAKPYKQLLDIHVAQHFGVERAAEFLKLYGADALQANPEKLARPYQQVIEQTRALYVEKRFFHWDLEFPEVFIDLERADWKKEGGFDAVVGNPPYVSSRNEDFYQETKSFIEGEYDTAFYQVDLYYLFMERASVLRSPNGFWSLIVPDAWVASTRSRSFRRWLASANTIRNIAVASGKVFEADVDCLVVVCSQARQHPAPTSLHNVADQEPVSVSEVQLPSNGDVFPLSQHAGLLQRIEQRSLPLETLSVTGRGIGAYHHSKHSKEVIDNRAFHADHKKDETYRPELGGENIGRYKVRWDGERWISYGEWLSEPRDPILFEGKRVMCRKILAQRLSCTFTDEDWLVDQQVYIAAQFRKGYDPLFVQSILASRLLGFYARKKYHEEGLFPHLRVAQFRALPISQIRFQTIPAERERLTDELGGHYREGRLDALLTAVQKLLPRGNEAQRQSSLPGATGAEEKSDVVHDFLAYLAKQMIAMHKTKQARVEAFWQDLAAATDPATFETLRNKGKWEQSLAKDPVCAPYIDAESRSTRNIDESLGWDEACFEAFAGMLVGRATVTPALTRVFRKHAPDYRALVTRIQETDDLIDQIVYRLYGLTEEEIAVVEGSV